jgi:hypothetical protein
VIKFVFPTFEIEKPKGCDFGIYTETCISFPTIFRLTNTKTYASVEIRILGFGILIRGEHEK